MQEQVKWEIDTSHTKIGFSVRHFGISEVDGFFRNYSVKVKTEKDDFSDLEVDVIVQVDSIDTNDVQRDAHLKAEDFFYSKKFPEMKFHSTQMIVTYEVNKFKMLGNLKIREITKPVIFDLEYTGIVFKDPFGNTKAGFFMSGNINRQDFGLSFNVLLGTGNLAVSNNVKINIPIELIKTAF